MEQPKTCYQMSAEREIARIYLEESFRGFSWGIASEDAEMQTMQDISGAGEVVYLDDGDSAGHQT